MEVKLQDLTLVGGLFDGWEIGVDELILSDGDGDERRFFVYLKDPWGRFYDHISTTVSHEVAEKIMLRMVKRMWRGKLELERKDVWNERLDLSIAPRFGATRGCE